MSNYRGNRKALNLACRISPMKNRNAFSLSLRYQPRLEILKHAVKVAIGFFIIYFGFRVVMIWIRVKELGGYTGYTPYDPWRIPQHAVPEVALAYILFGGFILYLAFKFCNSPWHSQTYRAPGTRPKKDGEGFTVASYAADESYMPSHRASTSGPFPVSKRRDREPTETFKQNLEPRRKQKNTGAE
jgi:hypothetical protein